MLLKNIDSRIRHNIIARNPKTVAELESIALNEEKALLATENYPPPLFTNLNPFAEEFVAVSVNANSVGPQNEEIND